MSMVIIVKALDKLIHNETHLKSSFLLYFKCHILYKCNMCLYCNVRINVYKYHVITTHTQYTRFLDKLILAPSNTVVCCHPL